MELVNDASIPPPRSPQSEKQAGTGTRKRKRDDAESIELDRRPFTIRPDSSDPFAAPRVFTPICLLPRARLPLAYLDVSPGGSRCFSACISALEALAEVEEVPSVLIAEDEKEKRLYAIERAQSRTYALCRLGQWVKREVLQQAASMLLAQDEVPVKIQAIEPLEKGLPWWSRAAVGVPPDHAHDNERIQLPKLNMMELALPQAHAAESAQPSGNTTPVPAIPAAAVMSAAEVLQELASNYQDALYLSRTSLAYFTKGPLSRARAAFSAVGDTEMQLNELTDFLRDVVLTAAVLDKKYKDALPGIITELSPVGLETPEQTAKPKRKRKWKAKRDKSGLFADEKEHIEKWWRSQDADMGGVTASAESVDVALKRRLPRVRSRETYLQVILVLEALALEATTLNQPIVPALAAESQDQETQQDESQAPAEGKKQKAKKAQDLPALLDILLDRLCIWHSVDFHSPIKKIGDDNGNTNDELRSFCVDVIVPFYMSRCPAHATAVNKKLGGPSAPTPVKRRVSSVRKPGEPATRHAPPEQRARKPLSRVATETRMQQTKRPPGLHRSATDTDLLQQQIKRETSEAPSPLSSIPAANSNGRPPQPRKRSSLLHTISGPGRREYDPVAMAEARKGREQRTADLKAKVQDAVLTLSKPNRAKAVEEVAESADVSFAKATARGKRPVPKSKSAGTAVHVTATPRAGRQVKVTPAARQIAPCGLETGRSSATSRVPSSSARLHAPPPAFDEPPPSTFLIPQTGHRPRVAAPAEPPISGVLDTPSRGFAKYMPHGLAHQPGTTAPESPIATRQALQIQQTPMKAVRSLSLVPSGIEALVEASPNAVAMGTSVVTETERPSMYDALGWEEDEYEPLA
ncbi:hypothetical protein LTR10_004104 [Elasticomyces elasticus]|nr:hypothetical protein LTR10_004104 [Elasticomyces elasticus]KAK4977709.1 hypothetical protein LTR42_002082 [Elasticomyces elasticus]